MAINNTLLNQPLSTTSVSGLVSRKRVPTTSSMVVGRQFVKQQPAIQQNQTAPLTPPQPGAYKGVPIKPGSQEDIIAQMRAIDTPKQVLSSQTTPSKGLVSTQPKPVRVQKPEEPLYPSLVKDLQKQGTSGDEAVKKAIADLTSFQQSGAQMIADIHSDPVSARVMQGRSQAVQQANLVKEAALQSGVTNALEARGQSIGALGTAAGLAAPQVTSYGQTVFNPLTGGFGGGGGNLDPQTTALELAKQVNNGTMTRQQAISSLGYVGGAAEQFFNNAMQQVNPNFNPIQAEVLAQRQGQVAPAIENARLSLQSLKDLLSKLVVPGQTSSFTPLNQLTNWASQYLGIGKEQTAAVTGTVNEVRNALQNALQLTGVNPVEATAQAYGLLPDNPSLDNVNAAIKVLESLGAIKQQVYGSPGNVSASTGQTSGFDW